MEGVHQGLFPLLLLSLLVNVDSTTADPVGTCRSHYLIYVGQQGTGATCDASCTLSSALLLD